MPAQGSIPFLSDALIKYLSETFPDRAPSRGTPIEDVWFTAGQASVVRHLLAQRDQIQEDMIDGSLS